MEERTLEHYIIYGDTKKQWKDICDVMQDYEKGSIFTIIDQKNQAICITPCMGIGKRN